MDGGVVVVSSRGVSCHWHGGLAWVPCATARARRDSRPRGRTAECGRHESAATRARRKFWGCAFTARTVLYAYAHLWGNGLRQEFFAAAIAPAAGVSRGHGHCL